MNNHSASAGNDPTPSPYSVPASWDEGVATKASTRRLQWIFDGRKKHLG
jgi:hypothetical protein